MEAVGVSEDEFLEAFELVCARQDWRSQRTVGLAISGGVDSMALATLYSKARKSTRHLLPNFRGLIIDHKVRPGSTEEAHWVAEQLRSKFDMESSIIPLEWPKGFEFANTQRFETEARKLRYRALGLACRTHAIKSLLLAHHADDQAETLLLRLIKARWRTGLQGMKSVDWIPECHGLYGVDRSGDVKLSEYSKHLAATPLPIERGGIKILRPLLGFEKERLIATCKENQTAWAEDNTNQNPLLTTRNAIRHVVKHHKLPSAISQTALIQMSQLMQDRVESHRQTAMKIFDSCPMELDIQTGSLKICFPAAASSFLDHPILTESDRNQARNTAHVLLQHVVELVSSAIMPSTGQLAVAVDNIWPALATNPSDSPPKAFSVLGVWFRPKIGPSPTSSFPENPESQHAETEWLLTRQPLDNREKKTIVIPPSNASSPTESEWHLFDNRFWIQVINETNDDLYIRTLEQDDINNLNHAVQQRSQNLNARIRMIELKAALNLVKPADQRFTIPGIFRKGTQPGVGDILVSLPTLRAGFPDREFDEETVATDYAMNWKCKVAYKAVDLGSHWLRDVVTPSIPTLALRAESRRLAKVRKANVRKGKGEKYKAVRGSRIGYGHPGKASGMSPAEYWDRRWSLLEATRSK